MIETIKNYIRTKFGKYLTIVSVFKTGSHLFCTNCNDYDYVVIVEENIKRFKFFDKETNNDFFVYSQAERNKELEIDCSQYHTIYVINETLKPLTTIYGDSSCKLDLFAKEKEYKIMLKDKLNKSYFSKNIKWKNSDLYCHRHLWWAIWGLMILENKSYEVTEEMRSVFQQCHDGVLPKKWETWVKERL